MSDALAKKVLDIIERGKGLKPPSIDPALYLDIAENIVRQATQWQEPTGMMGDPYNEKGTESITSTGRYTAAMGHLLRAGRCLDLLENAMKAMDWCCDQLATHYAQGKKWYAVNFNLKDMMVLYEAVRSLAPPERFARWTAQIQAPAPEAMYHGERNWVFYGTAAETMRIKHGLSNRLDWIDKMLETQMQWWTAQGMYRDPNDPVTYDLTVRQGLAFMLENGYNGAYAQWARETLRKGALATLLFVSPTGVAPYGGRSNQFHIMEGMIAYLAEWQAKQEARAGNMELAGALRRIALSGAEAVTRWALQKPYRAIKNQVTDHPFYGQDGYHLKQNAHSGYGLLAANLFAGAYHVADHNIPVGPAPFDIGGYVLHLSDAFWRVWATAGPYHIEIDTMGQPGHDATGLGRFHKRNVPIETALNMSIVSEPSYIIPIEKAKRSVALGVGWPHDDGWFYLSMANRTTHEVHVDVQNESDSVDFTVTYIGKSGGLPGASLVRERYALSAPGLACWIEVPEVSRLRLQVPVIDTDGKHKSRITLGPGSVTVAYAGHTYRLVLPGCQAQGVFEDWPAPNRNGIYRVVVFEVTGNRVHYKATLE